MQYLRKRGRATQCRANHHNVSKTATPAAVHARQCSHMVDRRRGQEYFAHAQPLLALGTHGVRETGIGVVTNDECGANECSHIDESRTFIVGEMRKTSWNWLERALLRKSILPVLPRVCRLGTRRRRDIRHGPAHLHFDRYVESFVFFISNMIYSIVLLVARTTVCVVNEAEWIESGHGSSGRGRGGRPKRKRLCQ